MKNAYFFNDPAFGLNDREPCMAYVRGLLENTESNACFERTRVHIMESNAFLTQAIIERLGFLQDERGIPILEEKLKNLGPGHKTADAPLFSEGKYVETLCLESLARIGGSQARAVIEAHKNNPGKSYLFPEIKDIVANEAPRRCVPEYKEGEFPELLKGIRSVQQLKGLGGVQTAFSSEKIDNILRIWRGLPFRGTIEYFSGDGQTAVFKPRSKIVDHVHDFLDPFTDFAIFRSDPKLEYPARYRRFADSHTYLNFPVCDGSLYDKQYTWDIETNTIHTHFHEHVLLEEATVNPDGISVTVANKPISTGVEVRGNTFTKRNNSAVRGVWTRADKGGKNYYAKRANVLTPLKRICYFRPLHEPIVNQFGIWCVDPQEHPERFFDDTGNCIDIQGVIEKLLIPLHEPKVLAGTSEVYKPDSKSDKYASRIIPEMHPDLTPVPHASMLETVLGVRFEHCKCGNAGVQMNNDNGYRNAFDINSDGIIDQSDKKILERHAGEVYRINLGDYGYFGMNWLSVGVHSRTHDIRSDKMFYVCSYDYGAGYVPDTGVVHLFERLTPGTKVFVEYYYDRPALPGKDNIKVYLHDDL